MVPIRSVGVQGDSRTYGRILAIETFPTPEGRLQDRATALVNQISEINRVIALTGSHEPLEDLRVAPARLTNGAARPAARGGPHRARFLSDDRL